ncbi:hypothetical protein HAP41_0000048690 (plasmid) [Bradyrhizobium barranii subsp. apii]|uniref:Uncharacterized protein n=1 Tax=Bradyrhizobium barranii subsp. apii TaxID=2819348 RepID=A0A8T5VPJ5_9BRAD|nr:hypothetical protein [Bradyrhizobium barranii]UPT92151.1 hypothetical protein HAP41_0000048690 [Bradyrhizobium barranii subsp. apii]
MPKAIRTNSTPQRRSSQNTQGYSTAAVASDPVVELSRHLLVLVDADDGAELEYRDKSMEDPSRNAARQFGEWRTAVERMISFSEASSLDGALVQLALALDMLDDIDSLVPDEVAGFISKRLEIERLVRSAMRAVRKGRTTEPTVQSLVEYYSGSGSLWIDRVEAWATEGRMQRERGD